MTQEFPEPGYYGEYIKLLTAHQPVLRGLILAMLPGNQDVDDILQNTNLILWEKRKKYNWAMDFKPWACTFARNKVREYRRKNVSHACVYVDDEFLDAVAQANQDHSSDDFRRKREALSLCMSRLKPREKDMMDTFYETKESMEFRMNQFAMSAASLRVTMHRIRKKLRLCIETRLAWEGNLT